jgi:hypothetical protein
MSFLATFANVFHYPAPLTRRDREGIHSNLFVMRTEAYPQRSRRAKGGEPPPPPARKEVG